jgi:addiction module HigA family antidote
MAVTAIHPGEHIAEELKELRMSAAELARKLDVPTNRITGILNGQRAISGDTALRLAHFFGTSAEFWLNLQSLYDLRLAEKKAGKSIKVLPRLKRSAGLSTWMRYAGTCGFGKLAIQPVGGRGGVSQQVQLKEPIRHQS